MARVARKKVAAEADAATDRQEPAFWRVFYSMLMKFQIDNINENPATLLRRAGYTFQHQENGEMSFVRPLASAGYPRYHLYAKVSGSNLLISFHLDQKKHTYGDDTRHHGEYENEGALKQEADHLKKVLTPTPLPDYNL